MSAFDVGSRWAMLASPAAGRFESFPVKEVAHRALRIAVDSTGSRHLLVPTTGKAVQLPQDGAAVRFTVHPLAFGLDTGHFLDVACVDSGVQSEFDLLIEEVIERITTLDSAATEALGAVDRWRRFLALAGRQRLSFFEQMGLMAELTVLDAALEADGDAVERWLGPSKSPHDFEFAAGCVEVKAIGGDLETVEIHGLHQLDEHEGRPLRLVLIEIFEDPSGMDVITYATDISERHKVNLSKPLAALGLNVEALDDHLSVFSAGVARVVPVNEEVPRLVLTSRTSEQDISAVRYRVRIAALLPFVVAVELRDLMGELIDVG